MDHPARVGDFDLKEPLEPMGPLGPVYRATRANRVFALRVFDPAALEDRRYRTRLARSLQTTLELRHPNLTSLVEQGTADGHRFAAYAFVDGTPIDEVEGGLTEREVLGLGLALCSGLEVAHGRGVFHGVITPWNIVLDERGIPQLLDLGLVRPSSEADAVHDLFDLGACLLKLFPGSPSPDDAAALLTDANPALRVLGGLVSPAGEAYLSAPAAGADLARALQGIAPLGPTAEEPSTEIGRLQLPGFGSLLPTTGTAATASPAAAPASGSAEPPAPGKIQKSKRNYYGDGFLLIRHTEAFMSIPVHMWTPEVQASLLAGTEPSVKEPAEEPSGYEALGSSSQRMIPSEDMKRVYNIEGELGRGGMGVVYRVRIQGERSFPGFKQQVEMAALKVSKAKESLLREQAIYSQPNPAIIKLLDAGELHKSKNYLLLETLYPHPYELFGTENDRARVDLATAINTFVNLLASLHELYFRKAMPLILCDIKPDNIMFRMPSREDGAPLTLRDYLDRLATNAYEPVLMDMGCAQHAGELRKARGRVDTIYGTPQFMPPETFPRTVNGKSIPGVVGDRMDVYALTLTFYLYLTGRRPYADHDLGDMPVKERIRKICSLKLDNVDPIDHERLAEVTGPDLKVFEEILAWGLHPNPSHRATAKGLFDLVWQRFDVAPLHPRPEPYQYDAIKGLRYVQQVYPTASSTDNLYLSPATHAEPPNKVGRLGPGRQRTGSRPPRRGQPPTGVLPRGAATQRYKRPPGPRPPKGL